MSHQTRRLKELESQSQNPGVWSDHQAWQTLAKEKSLIEKTLQEWSRLDSSLKDHQALFELLKADPDLPGFLDLKKEHNQWMVCLTALELKSFFSGPHDHSHCYVSIHAGAGGAEAEDWAGILQRMYFKWAAEKHFTLDILSLHEGDGGVRSVHFLVKGPFAYGHLQAETGVHRLVRISPFDSQSRRHTSFASVFVWPEIDDSIKIDIKDEDLKIDTYRAGGAGGQHVNKTDSAVRITYQPVPIVVQCQNQRSQHANRQQAMKMLKAALYKMEEEKRQKQKKSIESEKKANEWGSQIRSYILHPYRMVKDHRTQLEAADPSAVLAGRLDPFISAWLKIKPSHSKPATASSPQPAQKRPDKKLKKTSHKESRR